jgi:hypothetical protein
MSFGYLIEINELATGSKPCVAKKTQNAVFAVVVLHRFAFGAEKGREIVLIQETSEWRSCVPLTLRLE